MRAKRPQPTTKSENPVETASKGDSSDDLGGRLLQPGPGADPSAEPLDHSLRRSRGGLSTKIHQLVDGRGRLLDVALTAGPAGDSPMLRWLLADLAVAHLGRSRTRTRPDALLGDKS